ncbi:MAG: RNA ligase (ATP) [Thermoanaerobaculia bacterium]
MSSIIADVVEVEDVLPHPNADRLCLARIKGWQAVILKLDDGSPQFAPGDKVVYIPPDSTLPREMAERLGVVTYLSERTDIEGKRRLVVKRVRLRGEPSFGLVIAPDDPDWPAGTDVREHYGIGKYRPPVRFTAGDSEANHPLFQKYTDVENLRNYPEVFAVGEEVVVSEKIHGTNSRLGIVEGKLLAGSHGLQRQRPEAEAMATNTYWFPATLEPVTKLLEDLGSEHRVAILYGEIYGAKVQKLHYGQHGGLGFAAFDLLVDDRYLDHDELVAHCERHGVAMVPVLGRGPFSLETVAELSRGPTTMPDEHIREGVVVKPVKERTDPKIGRVILKYLSDDYLLDDKLTAADATDL